MRLGRGGSRRGVKSTEGGTNDGQKMAFARSWLPGSRGAGGDRRLGERAAAVRRAGRLVLVGRGDEGLLRRIRGMQAQPRRVRAEGRIGARIRAELPGL